MAETKLNEQQVVINYSTDEKLSGGIWIDGKPIYIKTINFGSLPNNTGKGVAHGITGLDTVVAVYGVAYRSSDGFRAPLPHTSNTSSNSISMYIAAANVSVETGGDRSNMVGYVTIEYTKS